MSKLKVCPQCKSSSGGAVSQMKQDILQNFVSGTTAEVVKYQCPYCGYLCAEIDSHGETMTAADLSANKALTGLADSLITYGRVNTSFEQNCCQPV